jgi:Glucose / Sorbosone dehydrogenase
VIWRLTAGVLLCLLATATAAQALTVRQVGNFEEPIYLTSDPGNPDRLFVVERRGSVILLDATGLRTFADISSKVSSVGEGGLLSIALAPDFDSSGRFFLDYTDMEGNIHVGEMVATGNSAPFSTLRDVIAPIPHPEDRNHYGGQLQFGPDGALYISTGDGGGGDDVHENAQDPTRLLGKILRVTPTPGQISTPIVWSLGLRNPFRFSFDRSTGAMLIGDVGQDVREEVDYASSAAAAEGTNYGWNCMEGTLPGPATDPQCLTAPGPFVPPIFEYPHKDPGTGGAHGCAIIGGYVASGPGMGDLAGRYLYGDLCEGDIRSFSLTSPMTTDRAEGLQIGELNSFGQDSCGRLYAISGGGPVFRLIGPESDSCTPAPPPPVLSPSYIGIRAISRKVKRHRRGLVTAWVTPCPDGRRGDPVTLWRGRRQLGTRHLDRVCSVRFRPRIDRRSTFRATVKGDQTFLPAISRKVTIRPVRHLRRRCATARCQ